MKKIYMTPATKWMEATTEEMMAGSDLLTPDSSGNPQQNLGDAPTTGSTSGNLSRESLWDFED